MAGIDAIRMVRYGFYGSIGMSEQPLTSITRARLIALGVNTTGIRTEAEGLSKLHRAENEQASKAQSKKKNQTGQVDANLEKARQLAKEINLTVSDSETLSDLIPRIKNRLAEMKTEAKDDFDKNSYIGSYQTRLDELESGYQSTLNIAMSATANLNIAFHGLY